jgi:hypothetical protein
MSRRMYAPLLIAAVSATLVAGCGGNGSSSSTTSTPTSGATTRTQTSSTPTATIAPKGSAGAAVAAFCESALPAVKAHLTSGQVSEFKAYCTALSHENASQVKASVKQLCTEILNAGLPASERSLATTECAKI